MRRFMLVVAAVLVAQTTVQAKETPKTQREEESRRSELIPTERWRGMSKGLAADYGAWVRAGVTSYDTGRLPATGKREDRAFRDYDLRAWLAIHHGSDQQVYLRVRTDLLDYNHGDAPSGDADERKGPDLDLGYWHAILGPTRTVDVTAGRYYVSLGSGLALARALDGVRADLAWHNVRVSTLAGRTVSHEDDIDLSRPGANSTRRLFYGVRAAYTGLLANHDPYVYALFQRDANLERPSDPTQDYDYDSNYFGVGSDGEVLPRLRYSTEFVYESGFSHAQGQGVGADRIGARALQAGAEYLIPMPMRPRVYGRYVHATGDVDRTSITNTKGGNKAGTEDRAYVAFGFIETGLAFNPLISNLKIVSLGGSIYPLKRLEVGAAQYFYWKDKTTGGISDPLATEPDVRRVGSEMDAYAHWRLLSDLAVSAQVGVFTPDEAFPASANDRTFGSAQVTFSF